MSAAGSEEHAAETAYCKMRAKPLGPAWHSEIFSTGFPISSCRVLFSGDEWNDPDRLCFTADSDRRSVSNLAVSRLSPSHSIQKV
jgi:hypothetical protein